MYFVENDILLARAAEKITRLSDIATMNYLKNECVNELLHGRDIEEEAREWKKKQWFVL